MASHLPSVGTLKPRASSSQSSSSFWSSRAANEHVWETSCYWWHTLERNWQKKNANVEYVETLNLTNVFQVYVLFPLSHSRLPGCTTSRFCLQDISLARERDRIVSMSKVWVIASSSFFEVNRYSHDFIPQIPVNRCVEGYNAPITETTLGGHISTWHWRREKEYNSNKNKTNNNNMVQLQAQPTSRASANTISLTCAATKDRL